MRARRRGWRLVTLGFPGWMRRCCTVQVCWLAFRREGLAQVWRLAAGSRAFPFLSVARRGRERSWIQLARTAGED